jgi:hypothetical protein
MIEKIENKEQQEVELSEDQKKIIRDAFSSGACPNLTELTKKVFSDEGVDARNKEGRAVKKYISDFQIGNLKQNKPQKVDPVYLTDEQKEKIKSLFSDDDFSTLVCARSLFNDESITPLHKQHKVVYEFVKNLKSSSASQSDSCINKNNSELVITDYSLQSESRIEKMEPYKAPLTMAQTIARINKYLNYGWKEDEIKKSQIKCVESLMSYLRVFRFNYQINSYSRMQDRELFEDAFIRYTHDKEDLTQEELDQFITLSNEVVIAADIQRRIDFFRISLDSMASDSEGKKISMGLNEAINNAQTEYNQCIGRQDKLYKSLTVNRSKRIEERRSENASILNLVYAWKQEENRARMIALAERQREALQLEVEKLSSMDEFKAIIRGIDPKEILNT